MRIVCISDTHNHSLSNLNLPEGDVLVHAGDATMYGGTKELQNFVDQMAELPFKHKLFVPGNHDFNTDKAGFKLATQHAFTTLIDEEIAIDGVRFYGFPWVPNLPRWAYHMSFEREEMMCDSIPEGVDVVISHGPPWKILDRTIHHSPHYGSEGLLNRLLKIKPKYSVFGHVHSGYGELELNGTRFLNVSVCDEQYAPTNRPTLIEYTKETQNG